MTAFSLAQKMRVQYVELFLATFAIIALLIGQWLLSAAIHGSNYNGWDGKTAQALVLAAFKYTKLFQLTSISPIEGIGSQMLTMNVWANPSFWPFAVFDRDVAADVSALVALGMFMTCCYMMARCFDLPIVPSAIAAQLCILLFAPALLLFSLPTNFCLVPGDAVVYAPHLVAFGLLARLEPGPWRRIAGITAGIFAMLFYSFCVDPLWTSVNGYCWTIAFAVVSISPFRIKAIVVRAGALGLCAALLIVTGMVGYLETISEYTVRVQYSAVVDRTRSFDLVSTLAYSPNMKTFYLACGFGWLLGLVLQRERPRVLIAAAAISFVAWVLYSTVYLLLAAVAWVPPIPRYVEHSLLPLYMTGAVAGYWGALQFIARCAQQLVGRRRGRVAKVAVPKSLFDPLFGLTRSGSRPVLGKILPVFALIATAVIPSRAIDYALSDASVDAETYFVPWPNEPELMQFLLHNVSSKVGQTLDGSIAFLTESSTMASVWAQGMHTIDEYSQLVTPQAIYFTHMILRQDATGALNHFFPLGSWEIYWKIIQLFGVRYFISPAELSASIFSAELPSAEQSVYSPVIVPRDSPIPKETGQWYIYKLPNPNVGNYSPTEVAFADSASQTIEKIRAVDFDFTRQVVLTAPMVETLVPAREMRLTRIRGGFHISGESDGTSLVLLPLQYSHCLRAADPRIRFVRADLLMAGMTFSGKIDTDITFGYGIFSPGCRRVDIADFKALEMKIDRRMPHLEGSRTFVDWNGAIARLHEVGRALGLLRPS